MAGKEAATQFDDEQIIEIEIERLRSFKDHPFNLGFLLDNPAEKANRNQFGF